MIKLIIYETVRLLFMISLLVIAKYIWIHIQKDNVYIYTSLMFLFFAVYDISVGLYRN